MAPVEEALLGRARTTVSFNPAIAARRGLSPRVSVLEAAGCRIGMGTDNMAEDMVEAMRTGLFMERIRREDGRSPTPEQALRWATRNGYAAMGMPDGGWLAPGNKADLVMIRTDRPHPGAPPAGWRRPSSTRARPPISTASWWMAPAVMRDGRVLTMDEPRIVAEADRIARRAWARLFAEAARPGGAAGFAPGP